MKAVFKKVIIAAVAALAIMLAATVAYGAFVENFDGYAPGLNLGAINVPGADLTANFGDTSWVTWTNNGMFATLQNRVLRQRNCNASLNIALDVPHNTIAFRYGTSPSTLVVKVDGWMGVPGPGTLVFSQNFNGVNQGTGQLEGYAVVHNQGTFDHIVIYNPGGCMSIDNLTVRNPAQ